MKTVLTALLFCLLSINSFSQADDSTAAVFLTPAAGYCTFSAAINTAAATPGALPAQFEGSADDDIWYRFVPWMGYTADPTIVSVIWVRFSELTANTGTPGLVAELWKSGTGMVDYYRMDNATADSIAFRNLVPGATYLLRIYTPGSTQRLTGGALCINQPCRNTRPGAQCQGGYGLGAEANNSCAFTAGYELVPHFPEIGCLPIATLENNTLFTTGDEGKVPVQAGSADDDVWFFIETSDLNRHSILLNDVVAVSPGTQVLLEWWDAQCNTRVAATLQQPVTASMRFDVDVPLLQKNTRYKLRLYTVGSGAMKGLRSFKICYESSQLDNDDATGAVNIPLSTGTCVFSPAAPNAFTTLGARPSVLVTESPGNATEKDDDVWFRFTAPATAGNIRMSFEQMSWLYLNRERGLKAELWDRTTLSFLSVQSLAEAGPGSRMLFSGLTPGAEYLLRLYSTATDNRISTFNLCLLTVPRPANDNCADALLLTATEAPFAASCTVATVASTEGASASAQAVAPAQEGSQDDDIWFRFTTTARTTAKVVVSDVATIAQSTGLIAELWSNDCNSRIGAAVVRTAAPAYSFVFNELSPSATYRLRLYTPSGNGNGRIVSMHICVLLTPVVPANDNPAEAIDVHFSHRSKTEAMAVGRYATTGATPSAFPAANCMPGLAAEAHNDVFFRFVPVASTLTLQLQEVTSTTGTAPGLAMEVLKKDPFSGQFVAFADACAAGHMLHLNDKLIMGNEYLLRVFNRGPGNESAFTLAGFIPPPPSNDTCINAIEIPYITDLPLGNPIPATSLYASSGPPEIALSCLPAGGGANSDLWYKFRVRGAGKTTRIMLTDIERVNNVGDPDAGGGTSLLWVLYRGTCNALTQVACGSEYDNFPYIYDGTLTYYLRVFSYDPQVQVKYKIYLEPVNYEWRNSNCANAITLVSALGGVGTIAEDDIVYNGFTEVGESDANDCLMPYPTPGVWYKFVAIVPDQKIFIEGLRATENIGISYPDVGYRLYEGNVCGSLTERLCVASFAQQGGALDGLTQGNTYYIRMQKSFNAPHVKFRIGIGYGVHRPNHDEFVSAFDVPMEPFCGRRNIFRQRDATLSTSPAPSAQALDNMVQGDTWIRFKASEVKAILNFYDLFPGMGVELYESTPAIPLTDYLTVPPNGRIPLPVNLIKGNEYLLRIYHSGSSHLEYRLCITGLPQEDDVVRLPMSACTSSDEGVVRFNNSKFWRHFTKDGKLIASIFDDQPLLGDVSVEYYLHPGPVRGTERSAPYLDRNFGITRTGTAIRDIQIIFYLTKQELDDLIAANPVGTRRVSFLNDLGIWRIPGEACSGNISQADGFLFRAEKFGLLEGTQDVYYVQFRTTNFSGFYLGNFPENPLPVTCKSFKAQVVGPQVKLYWTTASEINHKGFVIERSSDGNTYHAAGYVHAAAGIGAQGSRAYSFTDGTLKTGGRYFYRLKQEDLDGRASYTCGIQTADVPMASETILYPNPAKDRLTIRIAQENGTFPYRITDGMGRTTATGNVQVVNGIGSINVSALPDGLYMLRMETSKGAQTLRLLKSRTP